MIPWAYIIPSLKMRRRAFIIKVAPEIAPMIHRDALNIFLLLVIRILLSPLWIPLVVFYVIFGSIRAVFEYLQNLTSDWIDIVSAWWSFDVVPDFKGKEELEELTREAFWHKVDGFEAKGGKIPSYYQKDRPGHLMKKDTRDV